jgi:hypothetical protein
LSYGYRGSKKIQKTFLHPQIGVLTLSGRSMHLEGTPGRRLSACTAEPGIPDHDAMLLLDMTARESGEHRETPAGRQRPASS